MVFKKDADLGNDGRTVRIFGCRDFNGCNQVFLTVRPQRTDRELRAGQDDGLLFSWLFCATENAEEVPVAQKT